MVEQVSRALGGLAQTIRGGLGDIARQSIAGAEIGLRTAESGLRATQAELTIGSMRRKEFEEKQKQEFLGAPINFSMLVGRADEIALPDIITNVVPRWERIFGAQLDPKSGQFVKQDGTFVTNRELRQKSGPVMAEFLASVDLGAEFEKNDVRLGIGIDQATARGDTGLAQELQSKRGANRRKIEDHAENPIPRLQEQLNALTSASVRFQNVADISGVNAKIKTLQDQISNAMGRQTAFALEAEKQTGRIAIEQLKVAGRAGKVGTRADLTAKAMRGDEEARAILDRMSADAVEQTGRSAVAQVKAKIGVIDVEGLSDAIIEGRELIDNVKNTFGVPVQEAVRSAVLAKDPKFNFSRPRVKVAAIKSSLMQQQKQRGAMGSFVKNINKQLVRVDAIMQDVISRVGLRAVDIPIRELKKRFIGSGHEAVLEAYMLEISNEIGKLSGGSQASVRELSTEAQARWNKIHDPNLSFQQLKIVLDETEQMAEMRLESTDEEINETLDMLDNIREGREERTKKAKPSGRFKIIKVE